MSHRPGVMWALAGLAILALTGPGAPAFAAAKERPLFKEGEVIVSFAPGTRLGVMAAAAASVHSQAQVAKTMAVVGRPHVALVRFPKSVSVDSVVAAFRGRKDVVYAEPNFLAYIPEIDAAQAQAPAPRRAAHTKEGRATADPKEAANRVQAAMIDPVKSKFLNYNNDPNSSQQDGWFWISSEVIWPDAAANPMIAVIDTGVDYNHPDLMGRVVKGGDFANDDNDPMDDDGHGTHVAGIAAASTNNGKGIAGVSKAMIYAVKVLGAEGFGSYFDIASGIMQAANNPTVKILSMSLGGGCPDPPPAPSTLTGAMEYAAGKGKLIVVAMGNANSDITAHTGCPASYADPAYDTVTAPVTIAVGAGGIPSYVGSCPGGPDACSWFYDYSCKASYSNYASWMTIIAPGTSIFSTTPNNREFWLGTYEGIPSPYAYLTGTSMATPMVAGAASRAFSTINGGTAPQVKQRLVETGTPDIDFGNGYFIDTDGDGIAETECWPTGAAFNPATTGVNVAAAMKRAETDGSALDANGAFGLMGAKVTAYSGPTPKGVPGTADALNSFGFYRVLNIPMNNTTPYDFAINKMLYTSGNQRFARLDINDSCPYCVYHFAGQISVGASSTTRYNLVTDWDYPWPEIDQYIYGPSASPAANCSVGYSGSCGGGELKVAPYMKFFYDGGPGRGGVEFSQIKTPLQAQGVGTPYEFFTTDYCGAFDAPPTGLCGDNMFNFGATFRLWKGGVILAGVQASTGDVDTHNCTLNGVGLVDCDAWHIGNLSSAGVFTPTNVFGVFKPLGAAPGGDPDGVLPYLWRPTQSTRPGGRGPGIPTGPTGPRARKVPQ